LTERFHERSRQVHPDFFQTKSVREQALSLEHSAALNRAYRTLREPVERMAYLIRLESGGAEIAATAPPELLEEIFELQELREAYREAGSSASETAEQLARRQRLTDEQRRLEARLVQLDGRLTQLAVEWDRLIDGIGQGSTDASQAERRDTLIAQMREQLSQRTYVTNTIEDIRLTLEGRDDAKDRRH
jgi:DnaJ-domain-containing protein 1